MVVTTRKRKAPKRSEPKPTKTAKKSKAKAKPKAATKPVEEEKEPPAKEQEPAIDWANSAAKKFLKDAFKQGLIPLRYMAKEGGPGPRYIWDTFCVGTPPFNRMQYGNGFTTRLSGVRNDQLLKIKRKDLDQKAFDNFRMIHPRPTHDHNGVPLWDDGSDAQRLLKEDMEKGEYVKLKPKDFWLSRTEFQVYELRVFRDHIYQEEKLWKLQNYLVIEAAKKQKVIKDKPQKAAAGNNTTSAT